jgi:serine/threonine-protein kinase
VSNDSELPDRDEPEGPEDASPFGALLRKVAQTPHVPAELLDTLQVRAGSLSSDRLGNARALPSAGDVIDERYRIQAELGRGGMGVVFAARNLRTARDVALKWMLPRGLARSAAERSEVTQRFEREARAVGRIDHPNVVRVFDVGGDPDSPYLVMELLSGESLRARLSRGPLGWDEALALLLPALSGVAAAHHAGVVHRDLKPDNIFVCKDGVKVLDFGVSRMRGDEDHTTLTRTGAMLGTPAYMPLEQLRGSRDVDERTDVYALGVILYEALSGRLPYTAQTAADQAVQLATRRPTALGELVPALKGPRADSVMRALALEPSQRYANVEAFERALTAAGVTRRQPRTRWLLLVMGLVCLAAVASLFLRSGSEHAQGKAARPAPVGALHGDAVRLKTPASQPSHAADAPATARQEEPEPVAQQPPSLRTTPAPAPATEARSRSVQRAPVRPPAPAPRAPTVLSADQFTVDGEPLDPALERRGTEVRKAPTPALHPDDF